MPAYVHAPRSWSPPRYAPLRHKTSIYMHIYICIYMSCVDYFSLLIADIQVRSSNICVTSITCSPEKPAPKASPSERCEDGSGTSPEEHLPSLAKPKKKDSWFKQTPVKLKQARSRLKSYVSNSLEVTQKRPQ